MCAPSWTLVIALAVALLFYKMPVDHALASVVYGSIHTGAGSTDIAAVFDTIKFRSGTGQFDDIRSSELSITPTSRKMLIVGFCFGAFLGRRAGFGAPVAINRRRAAGVWLNCQGGRAVLDCKHRASRLLARCGDPRFWLPDRSQPTALNRSMVGRQPMFPPLSCCSDYGDMDGWRGVKKPRLR